MTHGEARRSDRTIIYRSELDFVSRCILDCPNIETGGELFGFWTAGGIPVVLFALSELQSRYERYKRGELGLIRGVLLPLAVFAYFYKEFVAPMIGIRWRRR